jgi:hypothetical protein
MPEPDIVVYYSLNNVVFNRLPNTGSSIYETFHTHLYRSPECTTQSIGTIACSQIIYDEIDATGENVVFLQHGTIRYAISHKFAGNENGLFNLPFGEYIFKISNGTGMYLNKNGFVRITIQDSGSTEVAFFFDKSYILAAMPNTF